MAEIRKMLNVTNVAKVTECMIDSFVESGIVNAVMNIVTISYIAASIFVLVVVIPGLLCAYLNLLVQ
jgi:hypothetical protein